MKINLKALGLALVAALAMSAVAASGAQAQNATFQADAYDAVLKGEQKPDVDNYFEITSDANHENGERTECDVAVYNATLEDASHELTVTPHYDQCNNTVRVNGCYFNFETAGPTNANGETPGTADVVCPEEDGEETTIEVEGPFGICDVHVNGEEHPVDKGTNQNLKGVTFTNAANGDVTVDVEVTDEIHYEETDEAFCPFEGDHTTENGNFVSEVLIEGFTHGGTEDHPTTEGTEKHPILTYLEGEPTDIFLG